MKVLAKEDNFNELIKGTVLVDFFANWCGPCKMLAPNLEQLDIDVIKVNVDEFEDLAREYKVMSIPALFLIKDGKIVDQKLGYQELDELKKWTRI